MNQHDLKTVDGKLNEATRKAWYKNEYKTSRLDYFITNCQYEKEEVIKPFATSDHLMIKCNFTRLEPPKKNPIIQVINKKAGVKNLNKLYEGKDNGNL